MNAPEHILAQLGGDRFCAETGSTVTCDDRTLFIRLPYRGPNRCRQVHVTKDAGRDTYTVATFKPGRQPHHEWRAMEYRAEVQACDLADLFEEFTGLGVCVDA